MSQDKVIPMCRYASQATQKLSYYKQIWNIEVPRTATNLTLK